MEKNENVGGLRNRPIHGTSSFSATLGYLSILISSSFMSISSYAIEAGPPKLKLTTEQMDHILALDEYQRHQADAKKLAYIAYQTYQNSVFVPGSEHDQLCSTCLNPLSIFDKNSPNAFDPVIHAPASREEKIDRAAEAAYQDVQRAGIDANRELAADALFSSTVTGAGLLYPELAPVAAVAQVLYPAAKGAALNNIHALDNNTPNLTADFTVQWLAEAYALKREGGAEGQAISKHFAEFSDNDVTLDSSQKTAVKAALAEANAISAAGSSAKALKALASQTNFQQNVTDALEILKVDVANRRAEAAAAAVEKAKRDAIKQSLGNAEGSFLLASYVLDLGGDKKAARVATTFADSTSKISNLVTNAAEMAPMMLCAGYVGVGIAIYSALQSTQERGPPWAAIFAMLKQISDQIEALRTEMHDTLGKLDARLGNLLEQNIGLSEATLANTRLTLDRINEVQHALQQTIQTVAIDNATIVAILWDAQDANCLQLTGNRRLIAPVAGFIVCRNFYVQRAVHLSRLGAQAGVISLDQGASSDRGDIYEDLRSELGVPVSTLKPPLANKDIWIDGASKFVLLADNFPKFVSEIDYSKADNQSLTIDPMTDIGRNLIEFRHNLVATESSGVFTFDPVYLAKLISGGIELRRKLVKSIGAQIDQPGVLIQANAGVNQPINKDYDFEFLRSGSIGYCPNVTPTISAVDRAQFAYSGGAHGSYAWHRQSDFTGRGFNREVNFRDSIAAAIKGFPPRELQLDRSILNSIPGPLLLMEQAKIKQGKLSACIANFTIKALDMPNGSKSTAQVDYALQLYLTYGDRTMNPVLPAGKLESSFSVTFNSFNLFMRTDYDQSTHGADLMKAIWGQMTGNFGSSMKLSDNSKGAPGITVAEASVLDVLQTLQKDIFSNAISVDQSTAIEKNRQELLAAISIGLNPRLKSVADLAQLVQSSAEFPSATEIAIRIIKDGHTTDDEQKALDETAQKFANQIKIIGNDPYFLSPEGPVEQLMRELMRLKRIRANARTDIGVAH